MRNFSYENDLCMQIHFHANQSHFHKNGFARRLALKQRHNRTWKWEIINFSICLGAGSRKYCRYTKFPLGIIPLKEICESPRIKENLTSVEFEPTTSGLDLPMLYQLSYEASTGAGWGNLGSESRLIFKVLSTSAFGLCG